MAQNFEICMNTLISIHIVSELYHLTLFYKVKAISFNTEKNLFKCGT